MFEELKEIREAALRELEAKMTSDELNELSTSVLGRGGKLTAILRTMGKLSAEERAEMGKRANLVKQELTERFEQRKAQLAELAEQKKIELEAIDVTLPGVRKAASAGALNPLALIYREIRDALVGLGFTTFRLVIPGRVFRVDEPDASHSPVFMQMEGLVVDRNVSLADLKGTIDSFVKAVFGENVESRLRPSYFPFTEPSAEVDISCSICGGKGCSSCKGTGWMEIMGCGITNPHEIENCGKSPDEWRAFAWGVGVDRVACLKYCINDIRLIYEGDGRFLSQFK